MRSDSISLLAKALVKAQGEFSAIPKTADNPFFRSKYAALPDVIATASPILTKNGLALSQFISDDDTMTTYLIHESGEFIAHSMKLHLVKNDPQAQGSAVTYARRYAYMSALGLVADADDDGNKATQGKREEEKKVDAKREELKKLLAVSHPDTADRKFFLEAIAGRKLKTSADLTDEEVEAAITKLGETNE